MYQSIIKLAQKHTNKKERKPECLFLYLFLLWFRRI